MFGAKPWLDPMMTHCQQDPTQKKFANSDNEYILFDNIARKISTILFRT